MQQHRIISLLSIVVMLVIPVIGWFLIAQPQLAAASNADQQRVAAAAQVATSQAIVDKLKADSANMPELENTLNDLRTSIPAGVDPSGYIDGLSALAQVSGVAITALTVSDPVAYVPPIPPVAVTAGDDDDEGEAEAPNPGIVTHPLVDSSNFVAIPVTIDVTGSTATILNFVNGLQSGGRLFLVTSLSTEAGDSPTSMLGKVGGYIYAIPTGVEGKPRPTSTIVKQMGPSVPEAVDPSESDDTATPTPAPSETPAP